MKWIIAICVLVLAPVAGAGDYCPPKHYKPKPPANNPSPPPVIPPPVVTPPPATHDCVYTGAGKDGQPGNDDCAPLPTPPTPASSTTPAPSVTPTPAPPVVQVVTRTVTKTVVKWRTKIKRVVVTKKVPYSCPKHYEPFKGKCRPTGKHLAG